MCWRLNPRGQAFGVAKYGKAHRMVQRNLDRGHRKEHAPVAERTTTAAPPVTVVVMGPAGVGKTTLIKVGRHAAHSQPVRLCVVTVTVTGDR